MQQQAARSPTLADNAIAGRLRPSASQHHLGGVLDRARRRVARSAPRHAAPSRRRSPPHCAESG
jgi:hypothetical protein